jgi:hypothetical protein
MDYDFFSQTQNIVAIAAVVIFAAAVIVRSGGVKEQ